MLSQKKPYFKRNLTVQPEIVAVFLWSNAAIPFLKATLRDVEKDAQKHPPADKQPEKLKP